MVDDPRNRPVFQRSQPMGSRGHRTALRFAGMTENL